MSICIPMHHHAHCRVNCELQFTVHPAVHPADHSSLCSSPCSSLYSSLYSSPCSSQFTLQFTLQFTGGPLALSHNVTPSVVSIYRTTYHHVHSAVHSTVHWSTEAHWHCHTISCVYVSCLFPNVYLLYAGTSKDVFASHRTSISLCGNASHIHWPPVEAPCHSMASLYKVQWLVLIQYIYVISSFLEYVFIDIPHPGNNLPISAQSCQVYLHSSSETMNFSILPKID